MGESDEEIASLSLGLATDTVATAIIFVRGVGYLMTAALAPGVIASVSTTVSAAGLIVVGLGMVVSVFWGSRLVFGLFALVEIGAMVGGLVGTLRWAVPYDPVAAIVALAMLDFVTAVALTYKTIQISTVLADGPPE